MDFGRNYDNRNSNDFDANPYVTTPTLHDNSNIKGTSYLYSYKDTITKQNPTRKERYRDLLNLKRFQVDELFAADTFATSIGRPLNFFISINWLCTDYPNLTSSSFRRCLDKLVRYLSAKRCPATYLYVHENPKSKLDDDVPNTHILLHLPRKIPRSEFLEKLNSWFGVFDSGVKMENRQEFSYKKPNIRLNYMAKGAKQQTCKAHGGNRTRGGQGKITFKRCGTSQNIGLTARNNFQKYHKVA